MASAGIIYTNKFVNNLWTLEAQAVKTTDFDKIYYDGKGVITAFEIWSSSENKFIRYVALVSEGDNGNWIHFLNEEEKRKFQLGQIDDKDKISRYTNFKPAENQDLVKIYKRSISLDPVSYCHVPFEWLILDSEAPIQFYENSKEIILPANAVKGIPECSVLNDSGSSFFSKYSNNLKNEVLKVEASEISSVHEIIASISYTISKIDKDIYKLFEQDNPNIGTDYIDSVPVVVSDNKTLWLSVPEEYYKLTNKEELTDYYDALRNYYDDFFNSIVKINGGTDLEQTARFILLMHPSILERITIEKKLELLEYIVDNKLDTAWEQIGNSLYYYYQGPIGTALYNRRLDLYEYLAVNLCLSFNATHLQVNSQGNSDIDEFLISLQKVVKGDSITLYQALYDRLSTSWNITNTVVGFLNNWVFETDFVPKNTRDSFVQAIYALWQFSQFNPYEANGTVKQNVIGYKMVQNDPLAIFDNAADNSNQNKKFYYTHETAVSHEIIYTNYPPGEGLPSYKRSFVKYPDASPMIIPYQSKKHAGVFVDNFSFKIKGDEIKTYTNAPHGITAPYTHGAGALVYPTQVTYKDFLYGTYKLFQPVSLLNVNLDTKVPILTQTGQAINFNNNEINSFIPAFVLHYVDDMGERSDTEKILGFAVDGILTFSGIGNLAKLRHLRWLGVGAGQVGWFSKTGLRITFGGIEFSTGVLSFFSQFVTCSQGDNFCNHMKEFITILEISTSIIELGDTIASLAMKRKARQVCIAAGGGATDSEILTNLKTKLKTYEGQLNNIPSESLWDEIVEVLRKSGTQANTGLPINVIAELVEVFVVGLSKRVLNQKKLYFNLKDTDFDIWVDEIKIPRFSLYKYESREVIIGSLTKTEFKRTSQLANFLHTEAELENLMQTGVNTYGLEKSDVIDLIFKSYRTKKQKSSADILTQLEKYKDYKTTRNGLLYCFDDFPHQNGFKSSFSDLLDNFDNGSFRLKDYIKEYDITGSVQYHYTQITNPNPNPNPKDLDISLELSKSEIREIIKNYERVFENNKKRIKDRDKLVEIRKNLKRAYDTNKVSAEIILRVDVLQMSNGVEYVSFKSLKDDMRLMSNAPKTNKETDFNIFETNPERTLGPITKIKLN